MRSPRLGTVLLLATAVFAIGGCAHARPQPTYAIAGANQASLLVVNNSHESLFYIYLSPTSQSNWGPDQLGRNVVSVGNSWRFGVTAGEWDIKVVDRSGNYKVYFKQIFQAGHSYTLNIDGENWTRPSNSNR